jgi:dTDP-glucose 4,6-dehydratase
VVVTRCLNFGSISSRKGRPALRDESARRAQGALYGDGGNLRDSLHVADHRAGIQLALAQGRTGEVYNIHGGTELARPRR